MLIQLTFGTLLILATITVSGIGYMLMELTFQRLHPWLTREPHVPKQMLLLWFASLGVLGIVTVSVWLWALAFWHLSAFPTLRGIALLRDCRLHDAWPWRCCPAGRLAHPVRDDRSQRVHQLRPVNRDPDRGDARAPRPPKPAQN